MKKANTMIDIGGTVINPARIVTALIETRYANGKASWLVVRLDDGSKIEREHGQCGFDGMDSAGQNQGIVNGEGAETAFDPLGVRYVGINRLAPNLSMEARQSG